MITDYMIQLCLRGKGGWRLMGGMPAFVSQAACSRGKGGSREDGEGDRGKMERHVRFHLSSSLVHTHHSSILFWGEWERGNMLDSILSAAWNAHSATQLCVVAGDMPDFIFQTRIRDVPSGY